MGEIKVVRIDIAAKLSEDDWKVVEVSRTRAHRLAQTRLATDAQASAISANITVDANGLAARVQLPPEDATAQHLMALRHFFLKSEMTYIKRLLNVLGRHMPGEQERQALRWFRAQWDGPLFAGSVKIAVNGVDLTPARVFDLWCNGEYFHSDADKAADLAKLWAVLSEPVAKYALVDSMYHWTRLVFRLHEGLEGLRRPS
jgi:hypothetical protein